NTAMKEQLVDSLAQVAITTGHPQSAIDALNSYTGTGTRPPLLLDRGNAYRAAHQLPRAVKDYQTIYYKYPLSDEAKAAGTAIAPLQKELRSEFPYATAEMQDERAQAFFDARHWREARTEFDKLVTMLKDPANPRRQRAQLRVAQCRIQQKGSLSLLTSLKITDSEVDAERMFAVSQFQRSAKNETEMVAAIDALAQKYPQS